MLRKKVETPSKTTVESVPHLKGDDNDRETVIMFVDIMGASEVSNHMIPRDYTKFVNSFQKLFTDVCKEYIETWYPTKDEQHQIQYSARGDEGLLMIYRMETQDDPAVDIDVAINIALQLKRQWLCSKVNESRIQSGLLPVDLAIGIHVGRTYIDETEGKNASKGNPGGLKLEGYAINLAKRVESHSRQGKFSHILLSEAAYGQLINLAEERTYFFDEPQVVTPKGISRDIRVHEVKHHFLPSDWKEESKKSRRTKTLLNPDSVNINLVKDALALNPTNLWLAEEYIRSSMLQNYYKLSLTDRKSLPALEEAFREAKNKADRLGQANLRDAGILCIQGLIEGECGKYDRERELYQEASQYPEQLAEAYWYYGQSISWQIWDECGEDPDVPLHELEPKELRDLVQDAMASLKRATVRRPQAAWMLYDYGCEIIRWASTEEALILGIQQIQLAAYRLPDVKERISTEPYLKKVRSDERIKQLLST